MDLHLLVDSQCYFCGKTEPTLDLSVKGWFSFSWSSVYDYHNPGWGGLYRKRIEKETLRFKREIQKT